MTVRLSSVCVSTGAVVRLLAGVVATPLLVRLLGLERYGIWSVVNSIVAMCALLEFGVSIALTTRLAAADARGDQEASGETIFTSWILVTGLGAIVSAFLWAAASQINARMFPSYHNPAEAAKAILLLSAMLIPRFWQTWAVAAESAMMRYDLQMAVETCSAIAVQVGTVLVVRAGGGLAEMASFWNWITALTVLSHYVLLSRVFPGVLGRLRFSAAEARQLIAFGVKSCAGNVGGTIFSQADRIIVNAVLGSASAGLYSSATSIVVKINELSALPLRVLQPAISASHSIADGLRTRNLFLQGTRLNGLIVYLMLAPLLFWTHPLAVLLVGNTNADKLTPLLFILAGIYGVFSLNAVAYWTAIGIGEPGINARWAVAGSVLMCTLLAPLAQAFGLPGAALANSGYILTLMINVAIVRHLKLNIKYYLDVALRPVAATLITFVIAWAVNAANMNLGLRIAAFLLSTPVLAVLIVGRGFLGTVIAPAMPGMRRMSVKNQLERAA